VADVGEFNVGAEVHAPAGRPGGSLYRRPTRTGEQEPGRTAALPTQALASAWRSAKSTMPPLLHAHRGLNSTFTKPIEIAEKVVLAQRGTVFSTAAVAEDRLACPIFVNDCCVRRRALAALGGVSGRRFWLTWSWSSPACSELRGSPESGFRRPLHLPDRERPLRHRATLLPRAA